MLYLSEKCTSYTQMISRFLFLASRYSCLVPARFGPALRIVNALSFGGGTAMSDAEEIASIARLIQRWAKYLIAAISLGGLGGMVTIGYGTIAAAQEVPGIKHRLNEIEMNVYFLCLMQEQADPAAHRRVENTLKIPVTCRPPTVLEMKQ